MLGKRRSQSARQRSSDAAARQAEQTAAAHARCSASSRCEKTAPSSSRLSFACDDDAIGSARFAGAGVSAAHGLPRSAAGRVGFSAVRGLAAEGVMVRAWPWRAADTSEARARTLAASRLGNLGVPRSADDSSAPMRKPPELATS